MTATSYPVDSGDWRGVFIRHLVNAIAARQDVGLALWAPPGALPDNVRIATTLHEQEWLGKLMRAGGIAHLMRNRGLGAIGAPLQLLRLLHAAYRRLPDIDLYHVNWLQNALPLPRDGRPALVSVLGTDMQLMKLPGMPQLLRHRFRHRKVAICPNADWMVPQLTNWFGRNASIVPIPFGIDERWFRIRRTPNAVPRWLCVSRLTKDKIGPLFDWCEPYFSGTNRELHLIGPMQKEMAIPGWVRYHGPSNPESLSRDWFPYACGLITLSEHSEGRPQVMLEAMAAGLPIIASNLPAHADLVQHSHTGWLCETRADLQRGLEAMEHVQNNEEYGQRAKDWARSNIGTWDDCAARYARVYNDLLASRKP